MSSTWRTVNPLTTAPNDQAEYSVEKSQKMAAKKTDLGLLEEDDEFEEFPAEGKFFA